MRAAVLILRKDLVQRARDRTVWIVGLVAPLALAAVLGVVLGDFGQDGLPPPRWGVVDLDGGRVGTSLADAVLPAVADRFGGTVREQSSRAQAVRAVENEQLDAAFVIPAGLTQAVTSGGTGSVEVVGRSRNDLTNAIAEAVARAWASDVDVTAAALLASILEDGPRDDRAIPLPPDLVTVTPLTNADRTLDGSTYVAAGMGIFFLFFTVSLGVVGLLEERSGGTLGRLLVSPNPRWSVVVGKVLTSIVIGWTATAILVLATTMFLGATWGSTIAVLTLVTAAVLAAVSLVSVVASFSASADTANTIQSVIGIVLGMLGGAFFPVATEPGVLATISDLTPHGMFLTAVGDLQVPGAGITDIVPQLLGLLTFGLATSLAGGAIGRLREVA